MNTQNPSGNDFDTSVVLVADQSLFRKEWEALRGHSALSVLAELNNSRALYQIYQQQVADQNAFSLALHQPLWLQRYFLTFLDQGLSWPKGALARQVFLSLAAIPLADEVLQTLLDIGLLDRLAGDQLQRLGKAPAANARSLVEYEVTAWDTLSEEYREVAVNLLLFLPAGELRPGSGVKLYHFLKDILPLFVDRFADHADRVCCNDYRLSQWFLSWRLFANHAIEGLPADHAYYQIPYAQIVQYVPEYILWNNGMNFGGQMRAYSFHSPEFRHLAMGGNFRNSPDGRYYSRGMARTLVQLTPMFLRDDFDLYLYAFCASLGVRGMLHVQLQEYIRLPEDPAAAKKRMDRWNPVIQKLAQLRLQLLPLERIAPILGYVYHCVRDQNDFSLQGRSLTWLEAESRLYYDNIHQRAARRREQIQRRRTAWDAIRKRAETSWDPHPSVSSYEWYEGSQRVFKVVELCTRAELAQEGARMNHCVASYEDSCKTRSVSIWSLRQFKKDRWYSLVTIELYAKEIRQTRGRFNVSPSPQEEEMLLQWADREGLKFALYTDDYY